MERENRAPVDLMLEGKLEEAEQEYLRLYLDALEGGDRFIGVDLVTQLHFCIAREEGRPPEEVTSVVKEVVLQALDRRGLSIDRSIVVDDVEAAHKGVLEGKRRAERSIERVEKKTERDWQETVEAYGPD